MMGCIGTLAWALSYWMHHLHLLIFFSPAWPCWATRIGFILGSELTADPDVQHLNDIYSWQPLNEPRGLQTTKLPPTHHLMCGNGRGLLCKHQLFPFSKDSFYSSVFVASPSRCFRSCTFHLEIHLIMVLSMGFSCWAAIQSVTCRLTCTWATLAWTWVFQTHIISLYQPLPPLGHEHPLFLLFPWWVHPGWTSLCLCPVSMSLSSEHLWLHCPVPFDIQC